MAYKNGHTMRLYELSDMGIKPNSILDIGAHTGQFHSWAKSEWPDAKIFMVESNELHRGTLDRLAMMNGDDNTNSSEGDDDQSSANMPENDTTISGSAILSSEMKATDLPSKRCIQKYNLNSEVQLALIDEINKSTNEEDKNSLIQELSNRSDLTIDELNEECFNN